MPGKRYDDYIFDLYGTLVDIHTDEDAPTLWAAMAVYYGQRGAEWQAAELQAAYRRHECGSGGGNEGCIHAPGCPRGPSGKPD